ncbi:MAG: DUF427 domain-containing protein [Gammaproteobacteria bacterium]
MEQITLVRDAIHRPDEPRHFMQFKFPSTNFVASYRGKQLAKTSNALVLSEVGYAIYDPVIYFPLVDVDENSLDRIDKTTHCPIKGDTEYFDLAGSDDRSASEIAWRYAKPLDFASKLIDYVAFDTNKIKVFAAE